MKKLLFAVLLLLGLACRESGPVVTRNSVASAPAMTGRPAARTAALDLQQVAAEAELIFVGQVERIEYRTAGDPVRKMSVIPHTFVTLRIVRVLHGRAETRDRITLRFIGGPRPDSTVLLPSHVPLFDIGDRDILFVTGNGVRASPLAEGPGGRFRSIGGRVYTDGGREVWLLGSDSVGLGPLRALEEVMQHQVGSRSFRMRYSSLSGELGNAPEIGPAPVGRHLSESDFATLIGRVVSKLYSSKALARLGAVRSARLSDSIVVRIRPTIPPRQ